MGDVKKNTKKKFLKKSNIKLKSFLFFILLAVIFWFLNALSNDYYTVIQTEIKYTKLPENKILINELPQEVQLQVRGHGFSLLQNMVARLFSNVSLDVSTIIENNKNFNNDNTLVWRSNQIKIQIEKQLSDDITVLEVHPGEIIMAFSDAIEKNIIIKPDVKITCQKKFMQHGQTEVEPDSILVKGPNLMVDKIKYIETEYVEFLDLNASIKQQIMLKPIEKVVFSSNDVSIKINVEEVSQGEITIPIKIKNLPDTVELKLLPQEIKIEYFAFISDYNTIKPTDFDITINFDSLLNNPTNEINPVLEKYPQYISHIKMYPENVSFIIEKGNIQ